MEIIRDPTKRDDREGYPTATRTNMQAHAHTHCQPLNAFAHAQTGRSLCLQELRSLAIDLAHSTREQLSVKKAVESRTVILSCMDAPEESMHNLTFAAYIPDQAHCVNIGACTPLLVETLQSVYRQTLGLDSMWLLRLPDALLYHVLHDKYKEKGFFFDQPFWPVRSLFERIDGSCQDGDNPIENAAETRAGLCSIIAVGRLSVQTVPMDFEEDMLRALSYLTMEAPEIVYDLFAGKPVTVAGMRPPAGLGPVAVEEPLPEDVQLELRKWYRSSLRTWDNAMVILQDLRGKREDALPFARLDAGREKAYYPPAVDLDLNIVAHLVRRSQNAPTCVLSCASRCLATCLAALVLQREIRGGE